MFWLALEYVKENKGVNNILILRKAADMFLFSALNTDFRDSIC